MTLTPEERRARAAIEAAEWTERLDDPSLTDAEKAEIEAWLRESPVHVAEFLATAEVRRRLARFDQWQTVNAQPYVENGQDRAVRQTASDPLAPRHSIHSPAGRIAAWAAAVLLFLAIPSALWIGSRPQFLITATGEKREVILDDGSIVRLLPESHLRVEYDRSVRRVRLSEGQALFRVAKDSHRPFVVEAGQVSVRAVGTAFSVQRIDGAEIVTVHEGRVVVDTDQPTAAAPGTSAPRRVALHANQQLTVSSRGEIAPVKKLAGVVAPAPEAFDWYSRNIVFSDVPVSEVVADFNRRNHTKIRLRDPEVAARRVTGNFADDDPRSFASFLSTIPGVAVRFSDTEITVDSSMSLEPSESP